MSSQISRQYNSRFAEGLDSYNNYMNTKDRGEISTGLGLAQSKLDDGKAKLQAQLSGLINEGISGISLEAGGKFIAKGLGNVGQFLKNTNFSSGADELGKIAQSGLAQQRLEGQKSALQEQLDKLDSPQAESEFEADRGTRMSQTQSEISQQQEGIRQTQSDIAETQQQLSSTSSEMSRVQSQFDTERSVQEGRIYDPNEDVSLSRAEVQSGNIEVSSAYKSAAQTELDESSYYSRLESMTPRPTPFTQARQQITTTAEPRQAEDVLERPEEQETFRPLNQTSEGSMEGLQQTQSAQQSQLATQQSKLASQQESLQSSQQKLSDISQEKFSDVKASQQSELTSQMESLDTGLETGVEGSSLIGTGLEAVGATLDFALPIVGIGMGIAGIISAGVDEANQAKKEAQAAKEKMNIQSNTDFDEAMINTRDSSGSQALMSNLDTAKFGSATYSHF